ncbi:MAG: RhuM family protein [Patescibacteria group bacterium]|nr:RhuM family protein [Patescibacteria group bacterium]
MIKKSGIVIYRSSKNEVELKVKLERDTVWLTQNQIADLFGTQRPAITKHLDNIFKAGELRKNSVSSILEHTAKDGKVYKTQFYNLDAIISVGYRVNSQRATRFRVWATKVLKRFLISGYAINEKRLREAKNKFKELQEAVLFLQKQSKKELLAGQEGEILSLLSDYSKTLSLLGQYDKGKIAERKGKRSKFVLQYEVCEKIITELKKELFAKREAGDLFGQERGGSFEGIIKGLYQTFSQKELYPAIADKAAHLLYLTIKDHPFSDGNKRTASFLFVYYLDKTDYLFKKSGERKINDNALAALALLVAESDPKDKEIIIRIIKNLISE